MRYAIYYPAFLWVARFERAKPVSHNYVRPRMVQWMLFPDPLHR
jgi:hypothetical protein